MWRKALLSVLILGVIWGRPAAAQAPLTILAYGDSLTAGYGLRAVDGFTAVLERGLNAAGAAVRVINGGVSGDTSAAGLARLDWTLVERPDLVLLALGANDALRGLDPAVTEANLAAILTRLQAQAIPVLLIGMRAPPNLGPDYTAAFDGIYGRLAARFGVPLYPFFLDGVAAVAALNQEDGMHPNAAGVEAVVARLLPHVLRALAPLAGRQADGDVSAAQ